MFKLQPSQRCAFPNYAVPLLKLSGITSIVSFLSLKKHKTWSRSSVDEKNPWKSLVGCSLVKNIKSIIQCINSLILYIILYLKKLNIKKILNYTNLFSKRIFIRKGLAKLSAFSGRKRNFQMNILTRPTIANWHVWLMEASAHYTQWIEGHRELNKIIDKNVKI